MRNLLLMMADDERFDDATTAIFGGTLFRATAQSTVCVPSRLSMLTGIPPWHTRVVTNDETPKHYLQAATENNTVVDHARRAGWMVGGVGKLFHHRRLEEQPYTLQSIPLHGLLDRECGYYASSQMSGAGTMPKYLTAWQQGATCEKPVANNRFHDERIASEAIWMLDALRAQAKTKRAPGFVLLVGFLRPHVPIHIPPGFERASDGAPPEPECQGWVPQRAMRTNGAQHVECSARDVAYRWYTAARRYMHTQMERVVSKVQNDTAILRTSDHGISMGEGCLYGKTGGFNDLATRVPLELRVPWRAPVAQPDDVQLLDVLPTIVDVLGWWYYARDKLPEAFAGASLMHERSPNRPIITVNIFGATLRYPGWRYSLIRTDWRDRGPVWTDLIKGTNEEGVETPLQAELLNGTTQCEVDVPAAAWSAHVILLDELSK